MNMWCLVDLGPMVESLFTKTKFIVLYLVTGVAGFALSAFANPGISAGASSPVMGLIGILIGVSFHHGGLGKAYRSQLWRWVIYVGVLGIFAPMFGMGGVDNAAHIGGFVTGVVLGYLIPEGEPETRRSEIFWNTLSVLSILVIAGSFALMALQLNPTLR
jgi:rhomboid protease GluP